MAAALAEQGGLQLLDESLCQWLHGVGQDHIHTEEVVASLDDVIDLDGLLVGEDAVSFVQHLNLIAGQPAAGHTSVAVNRVDLQVLIEAAVHFAVALFNKSFEKFGKLRGFLFLSCGLCCIFGYVSNFKFLISIWDALLHAIDAHHSL